MSNKKITKKHQRAISLIRIHSEFQATLPPVGSRAWDEAFVGKISRLVLRTLTRRVKLYEKELSQ